MTALHNTCDLNITPVRKRKRQCDNFEDRQENANETTAAPTSCFTNAAFCSTPKKIIAKRRFQLNKNKENIKILPNQDNLDSSKTKNKIEVNNEINNEINKIPQNPYEVVRKPPKKKKRHISEELACFENPALNLDVPEKLFNPYEVVRKITDNKITNCFSNPALNLKVQDASILCNPFEVQRQTSEKLKTNNEFQTPPKNPFEISPEVKREQRALPPKPFELKLCLPFAPKLGCRIDFKDVSISQFTPSKLLAEKLVFSPVQNAKLSLGSSGEESSMDIGKELDRYQLELENSINEAKLRKTGATNEILAFSPTNNNCEVKKLHPEQKLKFTQKLSDISEDIETDHLIQETFKHTDAHTFEINTKNEQNTNQSENNIAKTNPFLYDLNKQYQKTETAEVIAIENLDELYGCTDNNEDSFDFITPAPFIRAYTRQEATKLTVSKESQELLKNGNSGKKDTDIKKSLNVKNIIRKSIRKLVQNNKNEQQEKNEENLNEGPEHEKQNGFMNAIRHSFRRKTTKHLDEESQTKNEISIIDSTERTMKLKTDVLLSENMKVENLIYDKKTDIRSSLRKSTRDMRNQFLRSVFHKKHEEYDFRK